MRFSPDGPLRGTLAAPPDKSLSHRAALLAAMTDEPVAITGYLDAADTNSTLAAVQALGALVERRPGSLVVRGVGLRAAAPAELIDVGNAGTLMRLLPGWLAGQEGGRWTLDGDASIRRRPVDRVAGPLGMMGASIEAREGRFPPFTVTGSPLSGIEYELPVASAQVKSCVLLAGLLASGPTTVVEPKPSRDHTERMLAAAGVRIARDGDRVTVAAQDELELGALHVPGDPSSAAFHAAAAVLVPRSRIVIEDMGANWTRTGFFRILRRMGGIVVGPLEEPGDGIPAEEPVCELDVCHGPLVGTRRRARRGAAGHRRAAAGGAPGLLRRGRDGGARRRRAAAQGERPDRHRGRRAARARGADRGDRGRLRGAGDGRAARRRARGTRGPPPGHARRGGRPGLARGRRGDRHGGGCRVLSRLRGRPRQAAELMGQFHFHPDEYLELMHSELPAYERLQDEAAAATGSGAERLLELGTGTGETARRVLARHPRATLVGIDASADMLAAARLPGADLRRARLEDPLPDGPFDLVFSALAVHHLHGPAKADLFTRVAAVLEPGGRFVLADVVVPDDPADATTPLSPGYDLPSRAVDQLGWLLEAGLDPVVAWAEGDLAVITAVKPRASAAAG